MKHINLATILLSLLAFATNINAAERFVDFTSGDFLLNADNKAEIYIDAKDCKGVGIAAANLATDINKVCGATTRTTSNAATARIIAGTIGHSHEIDRLVKAKAIDKSALKGKREKYIITIADGKLIIAGSDRRGTIYGIYELSRQIGVSPWYYWADTPVKRHERIYIKKVYTPTVNPSCVIAAYSSTTRRRASPLGLRTLLAPTTAITSFIQKFSN